MGFGTVAANMLFFIAILTLSAGLIFYMNAYASETSNAIRLQQNRISDELRTNMNIDSSYYDYEEETLRIYARNTGETLLSLDKIDLHVDDQRIPKNEFTIEIEPDTLVGSLTNWNPREVIRIELDIELSSGNIPLKIIAQNGVTATDTLSI